MGKEQREAVLVVGIEPPHYRLRRKGSFWQWELVRFDAKAFESFAKSLAASIRKRSNFAWMTTTFNVGAGTRTSSDPDSPGDEKLPSNDWERIRAAFRTPDPEDYRILVPPGKGEKPVGKQLPGSMSLGVPGGPNLVNPPSSTAVTTPPTVFLFPGIRKIEALRKRQIQGFFKFTPITLHEYVSFFHDKTGQFTNTRWLDRRNGTGETDSPGRMVSIKAVLDYVIGGRDRHMCPVGEIHFVTVTDAGGPRLAGTPDLILLAKDWKPFESLKGTEVRDLLDVDGRVPIVNSVPFEATRANDFSSINTNVRDLRSALAGQATVTIWNGSAIPILDSQIAKAKSIPAAFRKTYPAVVRQSFATQFASLPMESHPGTSILSSASVGVQKAPLSVFTRGLGIQGTGTTADIITDPLQEKTVIKLCKETAKDAIKLDVSGELPFKPPSGGLGFGRILVAKGATTAKDLLAERYPIMASDIERLRQLTGNAASVPKTVSDKIVPSIIKALDGLKDDGQLLRALAQLDTLSMLDPNRDLSRFYGQKEPGQENWLDGTEHVDLVCGPRFWN